MNQHEQRQAKISGMIKNEALSFSECIRMCRVITGMKICQVCQDLGLDTQRLRYLESGAFKTGPTMQEILKFVDYYGLPQTEIIDKLESQLKKMTHLSMHGKTVTEARLGKKIFNLEPAMPQKQSETGLETTI